MGNRNLITACIKAQGLSNSCFELRCLQKFIKQWLMKFENGEEIIRQQRHVAKRLMLQINLQENRNEVYGEMYHKVLRPCAELIEKNRMEEAFELYDEMVRKLTERYLD